MDLQASVAMDLGIRVGVAQKRSEFPLSPAETTSLSLSLSLFVRTHLKSGACNSSHRRSRQ